MDIVTIIVFIIAWLFWGFWTGFMVYVTPNPNKGYVIAAVLVSWALAMLVACFVHMKRHPKRDDNEK